MVQTIGRCHVSLLKNVKTLTFWEYDKGNYGILINRYYLIDFVLILII